MKCYFDKCTPGANSSHEKIVSTFEREYLEILKRFMPLVRGFLQVSARPL